MSGPAAPATHLEPRTATRREVAQRLALLIPAVVLAGYFSFAYDAHVPSSAGPDYWRWPFRSLEWSRVLIAVVPALAIGAFACTRTTLRSRAPWLLALAFLWFELAIVGATDHGYDLRRVERIVVSPGATSYWNSAVDLLRDPDASWLAEWHERMPHWHLHARNKPPIPVLFYVAMHWIAGERGALLGGLLICMLAALVVPATYSLSRALGMPVRVATGAAVIAALAPGLSLIAPEFDQVYPLITAAAVGSWAWALRARSHFAAALTGIALLIATWCSFHLAVIGLPLAVIALLRLRREGGLAESATLALAAIVTFVAGHALLSVMTGYDLFAVLHAAVDDIPTMSVYDHRVGPESRVHDVLDFARAVGWPALAACLGGIAWWRRGAEPAADVAIGGVLLIATLAGLRLLPAETARVWMFIQPLLFPMAGVALMRMGALERSVLVIAALVFLIATARNLIFIAV